MECELLKMVSSNKDTFEKYSRLLDDSRLSSEIQEMYRSLPEYFGTSPPEPVEWTADWYPWYTIIKHPSLKEEKAHILKELCSTIDECSHPRPDIMQVFVERDVAAQIGDMALEIVAGSSDYCMEDVEEFVTSYKQIQRELDEEVHGKYLVTGNIEDDLRESIISEKYDWRLNELNLSIGPIKKGDFIIVGARPDSGKTSFLASEMTHMAGQLGPGERILWCNNEEPGQRVRKRYYSAALNWTEAEVCADIPTTVKEYTDLYGGEDKILMRDSSSLTIHEMERIMRTENVKIAVLDQLWKLKGFERSHGRSEIERFGKIAEHLRWMAKEYAPIITTSQLDGAADGEKYPSMSRLYNSKTAVQGEADVILMIGRDPDEPDNARFLYTPKNKLGLGVDKYRNARWAVEIDGKHARFISKVRIV